MKTGLKDKNNTDILIGQRVRFKCYNHWYEAKVEKWEAGIYPFIPDISEKLGLYIAPEECEVVKPTNEKHPYIILKVNHEGPFGCELIGNEATFFFNPQTTNGEEMADFIKGCQEIYLEHLQETLVLAQKTIRQMKLSMLSHPDCTEGSEFDDQTSLAERVEKEVQDMIDEITEYENKE